MGRRVVILQRGTYLSVTSGAARFLQTIAQRLAGAGCDVVVVARWSPAQLAGFQKKYTLETQHGRYTEYVVDDAGIQVCAVTDARGLQSLASYVIARLRPHLILVSPDDPRGELLTAALAFKGTARVVSVVQSPASLPMGPDSRRPSRRDSALLHEVDLIFTVSEYLERYIQAIWPVPAIYCHPFDVVSVRASPTRPSVTGTIVMVNPSAEKGSDILLAVARLLRHRQFVAVAGWATTQAVADAVSHEPNIELVAWSASMHGVLADAAMVLVPSIWAEAFGLMAFEAMDRGIPVIVSDRGGLPEIMGDGVPYVVPVQPGHYHQGRFVAPPQRIDGWSAAVTELTCPRRHALVADLVYRRAGTLRASHRLEEVVNRLANL